jgi:ribosomal protein S27AE
MFNRLKLKLWYRRNRANLIDLFSTFVERGHCPRCGKSLVILFDSKERTRYSCTCGFKCSSFHIEMLVYFELPFVWIPVQASENE